MPSASSWPNLGRSPLALDFPLTVDDLVGDVRIGIGFRHTVTTAAKSNMYCYPRWDFRWTRVSARSGETMRFVRWAAAAFILLVTALTLSLGAIQSMTLLTGAASPTIAGILVTTALLLCGGVTAYVVARDLVDRIHHPR